MHGVRRTIQPKEARDSWRCRRLPRGRHTSKPALVHLEELDVVRVVLLRTAERLYAGTEGVRRAPRLGDQGIVVMTCLIGNANEAVTVKCVSPDGALIWLADFAVDELELTVTAVATRRQRAAGLTLATTLAFAGCAIGFLTSDLRGWAPIWILLGLVVVLPLLVLGTSDLGRALDAAPDHTPTQRLFGILLRGPLFLVGVAGVVGAAFATELIASTPLGRLRNAESIAILYGGFLGTFGGYLLIQPFWAMKKGPARRPGAT